MIAPAPLPPGTSVAGAGGPVGGTLGVGFAGALALVALVVVVAVVAGVAVAAATARRRARATLRVVPGHDSAAPASWARSHSPEARLHRRLRAAVAAVRALPDVAGAAPALAELDRVALDLDRRLVAVATVPASARPPALARIAAEVEAIEAAVGELAERRTLHGSTTDHALQALVEHLRRLDEARAEVEAAEASALPFGDASGQQPAGDDARPPGLTSPDS